MTSFHHHITSSQTTDLVAMSVQSPLLPLDQSVSIHHDRHCFEFELYHRFKRPMAWGRERRAWEEPGRWEQVASAGQRRWERVASVVQRRWEQEAGEEQQRWAWEPEEEEERQRWAWLGVEEEQPQ